MKYNFDTLAINHLLHFNQIIDMAYPFVINSNTTSYNTFKHSSFSRIRYNIILMGKPCYFGITFLVVYYCNSIYLLKGLTSTLPLQDNPRQTLF